ncbi:MAG: MATE family efflux transporter [Eubacteriales bacterium]|nr:MATE family efflux transporter [Eubacteriales bacterium]
MDKDRIDLLGTVPVRRALVKLAIPSIIAMLINAIYNLTDTYFIGQLNNSSAMASITIAFPIMSLVGAIGGTFGVGGGSYLSRLLGEKEYDKASVSTSVSLFSALVTGLILTVFMYIFLKPILLIFGASDSVLPYAMDYTRIIVFANVITMLNMTLNNLVRAEGAAKHSMYSFLIGSGLNIILDPIFIFTLNLGVAGAAYATLIGKAFSFAYLIYFYIGGKSVAKIGLKYFKPTLNIYKEILKVGMPSFVRQGLASISMGMVNSAAKLYGDAAVAGMGVSLRVTFLSFFVLFGYSVGFQPIAGYSWGSGNFERLKESIRESMKTITIMSVFFAIVFFFFARPIVGIFSKVDEVIHYGVISLRAMAIMMPFLGFQNIVVTLFQAIGKGNQALVLSLSRQGIFYIPAIIILPRYFGIIGLIYAQPFADFFTVIVTAILMVFVMKEIRKLQ